MITQTLGGTALLVIAIFIGSVVGKYLGQIIFWVIYGIIFPFRLLGGAILLGGLVTWEWIKGPHPRISRWVHGDGLFRYRRKKRGSFRWIDLQEGDEIAGPEFAPSLTLEKREEQAPGEYRLTFYGGQGIQLTVLANEKDSMIRWEKRN